MSLIGDLIAASGASEVTVKVIRCTCPPGRWPCECTAVRLNRTTIVRAVDGEAFAAVEEERLSAAADRAAR